MILILCRCVTSWSGHHLLDGHLPVWLVTILADGIGGGIQTVATFIPVIAALLSILAVLESSGWARRAAFVLIKRCRKSACRVAAFCPLVLGFAVTFLRLWATMYLTQERERNQLPIQRAGHVVLSLPHTHCRQPHFSQCRTNVVLKPGIMGIVASFTGLFLKNTIYPGSSDSLVTEMLDYELPTVQNVMLKTWQKNWSVSCLVL